ncbi:MULTISPECIES: Pycsar system effector family protein [Peribacillus]|uniref:Pycsar system effector family protein n=1 Tax=Peribacillus TaxID=2675229 RepID=UPI000BA780FB|nr:MULTISPECIES: Pycsar system effector family protein [Peribacillus]MCM3170398.1 DUF5706 domain-containing protein [Peribacillus frigoritolerans]PAL04664.1 hypothetical protein B8W99_26500 [Peribacillus simplex]
MSNNTELDKDNLLNRLDRLLEWIKSCDTKSSIVLAGIGIFLTIFTTDYIINVIKNILVNLVKNINFSNILYLLLFAVSIGFLIYGTYCLTRVLVPRLEKDNVADEGRPVDSLYFFETIAKNNYGQFKDKMNNTTKEEEIEDILSQIYVNARICTFKYQYSSKGIKFSFIGIAGVILLYVVGLILMKMGGFQ